MCSLRDVSCREEKLEAVAEHLEVDWPPSFVMRECAMLFVFAGGR